MKETKTICELDTSLDNVERFIGNVLEDESFNELNYLQVQKTNSLSFNILSKDTNLLTEAEFITLDKSS